MGMQILRRLASGVLVLFLVTIIVFTLLQLGAGNAARAAAGGVEASQADIERAHERLGLDRPVIEQYASWASGLFRGDLGNSYISDQPVIEMIANRIGVTLTLTVLSIAVGSVVAIVAGVLAASRPDGLLDRSITFLSSIGIATPPFVVALVLLAVFAIKASVFPAINYVPLSESVTGWFTHLVLPVTTLSIALAAELSRYVRASVRDVLDSEYVKLLYLQGFHRHTILFRYALKSAAVPFTTVIGLQISHLVGGIVVVETVFDMPGIGWLAVRGVLNSDMPVVAGVAMLIATLILIVNLVVDVLHKVLDPRVVIT